MREQPPQQPPPVQKVRLRYTKTGRLRFSSHRDFSRAFERALKRAAVPMAYSSGFHPHPRISYANAAPTGAASEAEYVEIGLATEVDPEQVRAAVDEALPPGLDIVEAAVSPGGSLADLLQASEWHVTLGGVEPTALDGAVAALLAAPEVLVERMTKRGLREFDVREAVLALDVVQPLTIGVGLRHGTPAVRPDDVVKGLVRCGMPEPATVRPHRLRQGPLSDQGTIGDPLAPSEA
ncbi:TIGR03936 family radical SAM-associated protein [Nocardioidaceae bacterium]|nr:TIGR03936 family radical SAM-associated protein [Nocardioidaceae bacterium]